MDFLRSKFDNLALLFLILILIGVVMYGGKLGDEKLVAWLEQTVTTVLGAYIGLTQSPRQPWVKQNGGTSETKVTGTVTTVSTEHKGVVNETANKKV